MTIKDERPHGRREGSRRVGGLLQRSGQRGAQGTRDAAPLGVRHWQIGNETSYDRNGFDLETAARKTVEFAKAMRAADPAIQLIAWGDSGWAARMAEVAGEHVQYLAFHHMFDPDDPTQPVLRGELYRRDPDATWEQLMKAWEIDRREDSRRCASSLGRAQDSAGDDGVPLHDSGPRSRATCSPRGRPASPTRASSTTTSGTATC